MRANAAKSGSMAIGRSRSLAADDAIRLLLIGLHALSRAFCGTHAFLNVVGNAELAAKTREVRIAERNGRVQDAGNPGDNIAVPICCRTDHGFARRTCED